MEDAATAWTDKLEKEMAEKIASDQEQLHVANQRAQEVNLRMQAVEKMATEATANARSVTEHVQATAGDLIANHERMLAEQAATFAHNARQ